MFMKYNFTLSQDFSVDFTDIITIPVNVQTGYTTNIYGDFELFQRTKFLYSKINSTELNYNAYTEFSTHLDLERAINFRNDQNGIFVVISYIKSQFS